MFKTKVKNIFTLFGLLFCLSLLCCACKGEDVDVEKIKYVDTNEIVLVVGERYAPQIEVVPSYASNKDYYFEMGVNSGILEIKDKTIVALKEGNAQLKVVSCDNSNINDVISIKVISSPITLSNPQNLKFDGTKFSFDSVDNASGYVIDVNGKNI